MAQEPAARQFLLLSPYGGDNLGDGAIQEAFIQHIQRRVPDAVIHGLTLHPAATQQIHDIPCRAVSAIETAYYAATLSSDAVSNAADVSNRDETQDEEPGAPSESIVEFIKRIPIIGTLLRKAKRGTVKVLLVARNVLAESARLPGDLSLCRTADCLLVAGGGQLDDEWGGPWGHPYVLWKWSVLCAIAGTRFRFVGVGYSNLHHWLSRWFAAKALRRCTSASFRDARSMKLAMDLHKSDDYSLVPDMAFAHLEADPHDAEKEVSFDIGISPIAFMSEHYWPEKDADIYTGFVSALAEFLVRLEKTGNEPACS